MKIKYLRPIIGFILLFLSVNFMASAATVGDFRSINTGNWSSPGIWERFDGTAWVATSSYPGQSAAAGDVLVRDGHTVTLAISPALAISSVSIGEGLSGKVIVSTDVTVRTTLVTVYNGGLVSFTGSNSRLRILENGIFFLNGGKLDVGPVGDCNNTIELWIGDEYYAACVGNNATYTFADLNAVGGSMNVAASSNAPVCDVNAPAPNNILNLSASTSGGSTTSAYSYSWTGTGPNGYSLAATAYSTNPAKSISGLAAGTYSFTVTARDNEFIQYTNSETISVTVNISPKVTAKSATVCSGSAFSVTPVDNVNDIVPAGTTYSWSAPMATGGMTGGSAQSGQSSISQTLINSTNSVQTATYTVTPSTGNCPGSEFSVTVTVNPSPSISTSTTAQNVSFSTSAQNTTLAYSAVTNTSSTYSITWNTSPANSFAPVTNAALPTSPITIVVPANTALNTYTGNITVTNSSGCISSSKEFTLTVGLNSTTTTAANASASYGDNSVNLTATISPANATGSVEFFIDGSSVGTSALSSGTATLSYSLNGVNANTYTIKANYLGSTVDAVSSSDPGANGVLTVAKAAATLTLGSLTATYDGSAHSATASTSPAGLTGLSVTGSGTDAGSYPASASLVNDNYTATPVSGSLIIAKAAALISVSPYSVSYDGTAHTSAFTAVGVETTSVDLTGLMNVSGTTHTDAGTYSADAWTFAGNSNYNAASGNVNNAIGKAATITTVSLVGGPFAYTGAAQTPATVTVTGPGGLSLTPTADYANNTNAGSATASYTYAGDANYAASSDSENFTIGKAATTTTVTIVGGPFTYTGSAQAPATVTVTGPGGLSLTPTADYANNTNAGTATASYTYAGDANYAASSDSENFIIGKAATITTITIVGGPFVYTGSAQAPATVTVTGPGGLSLTPTADYANNTNAGTATASYTYAGDANYEPSADSDNFTIGQKTASVTPAANSKIYGAADPTLTGATSGFVAGDDVTASYSRTTGETVAGSPYTISATLSPAGVLSNYDITYNTASFTIGKAPSVTTVTIAGAPFTYTGAAQTPATVTVTGAGGLSLTPTADYTNNTDAGTATASYSYAGDANYEPSADSENFTIGQKTASVTPAANSKTYGAADPTFTGATSGFVAGDNVTASYSRTTGETVAGSPYTISATLSPAGVLSNYDITYNTASFTIGKAPSVTTVTIAGAPFTYTGAAQTPATVTVTGPGLSLTPTADYANNTNAGTATASYSYAGDANYEPSADSENFTIGQKTASVTPAANSKIYGAADPTFTGATSGFVAGDNVTASYSRTTGETVAGSPYTISATLSPAGVLSNYDITYNTASFTIGKAPSVTTVTIAGAPFTYTGAAQTPATVTVTGAGGLSLTPTADYANNTNAGTATASYSYAGDANYEPSADSDNFTIGQKTASVTPAANSKTYGAADPTFTGATSGFVAGDNVTASYSRTTGETVAGSPYTISATLSPAGVLNNYDITYNTASFTIGKAPSVTTITIAGAPFTYTGAAQTPATVTVTGPGLSLTPTADYANNTDAGTATASYTYAGDANYEPSSDSKTFTIGQKTASVTPAANSKIYGAADPTFTGATSGFVAGDNVTASYSRTTGETVAGSPYTISATLSPAGVLSNYDIRYNTASFTIGKAPSVTTVTIAGAPFTYTGAAQTPATVTVTGAGGLSLTPTADYANNTNAGTATASYSYAGDANYEPSADSDNFTIRKAAALISVSPYTVTYDGAAHTSAFTVVGVESTPADLTSLMTVSGTTHTNAGTYTADAWSFAGNSNYSATSGTVNNQINKATSTLAINVTPYSLTYDGAAHTATGTATGAAGENLSHLLDLSATTHTAAGTYTNDAWTFAGDANHAATSGTVSNTIGLRALTVSADPQTRIYGNADPALSYQITSGSLATGDAFTGTLTRAAGENVGSYAINQGSLSLNSNYILNYAGADLTITRRPIEITADPECKVYGDPDNRLTYRITSGGRKAGDQFKGSQVRDPGEDVGTYIIRQGTLTLGNNYDLVYKPANFCIVKRSLTITADAQSKIYGDPDPALTYAVTEDQLVLGDTFSGSLSRNAGEKVGSYPINQGTVSLSDNYKLTFVPKTLVITKRDLVVTANSQSKVYGSANPTLTMVYSGFAGSDNAASLATAPTLSTAATTNSPAGTYPITASGGVSPNYSLSYVPGQLEITKAGLTITADNKSRIQGTANPALSVSYSGFVNGETSAVFTQPAVPSTSATGSSLPGNYPIQVSGASAANYTIAFVNGVLTVAPGSPTSIAFSQVPLFENQPAATAAGSLTSASGDPNASYTYSLVSGSGDTDNSLFSISGNKVSTSAPLNYEGKASYSIRVRATTAFGLSLDKQLTISLSDVNEAPTMAAIADQTICYTTDQQSTPVSGLSAGPETAQSVSLAVSSSNPNLFASLTVSQANANGQAELKYRLNSEASGTATITVTATDNGGTDHAGVNTYSRTFTITVSTPAQTLITVDKGPEVDKGDQVKLTASGGSTYSWSSARGVISGQQTAVLTVRPPFTTTYQVKITNAEGCVSVQQMTITVRDDFKNVIGNNILSPNGDGLNDKFVITNIDMYENEIRIFDRAGRILFSQKNYANDWEGTFNNERLAEDTYYYIVDFGPAKGKLKGFITIVRD